MRKPITLAGFTIWMVFLAACGASTSTPTPAARVTSELQQTPTETTTKEATEAVIAEATEAPTKVTVAEATEAITEEATEEMTREATEEATKAPTKVAVAEATKAITEEATEEVTREATREATEEATPEATPMVLDATFTSEDGSITFDYPADWVVKETEELILIANSQKALESKEAIPASGEFRMGLSVSPISSFPDLTEGATAMDVVQSFADTLIKAGFAQLTAAAPEATAEATTEATSEATAEATVEGVKATAGAKMTLSEPEEVTVGKHSAALVTGVRDDSETVFLAVDLGDGTFAVFVAASAADEMSNFKPTLLAIAETLTYTPTMEEATAEATGEATEEGGG